MQLEIEQMNMAYNRKADRPPAYLLVYPANFTSSC